MSHAFSLRLDRKSDTRWSISTGSIVLPVLEYDNSALTQEQKVDEHMGGRLLAASTLACYTNSLWNDIKRAGATPISINATVDVDKFKDSSMRTTFGHFEMKVEVEAENLSDEAFNTIRSALYRGSLVTYSMEEGIEFDYNIQLIKK